MRGAVLFVAGIVVGAVMTQTGVAPDSTVRGLNDVDGVQIDVMELGLESLQRKAIDAWK